MGATKTYKPKKEDIDNFRFTGYLMDNSNDRGERGNGWTQVYAPSIVNKELLKINPDTEQTYLQDIKDELTELRYEQEVMAQFGDSQMGVYKKELINYAIEEGRRIGHVYSNKLDSVSFEKLIKNSERNIRILGVDWDKVQSGSTLVAIEFDKFFINSSGENEPKFKVLFRIEIPRSEFTYVNAINKIIQLNETYNFDWIAIDRGYGKNTIAKFII